MWTYTLNILYLNYIEIKVVTSLCLGKSLQFVAHIAFYSWLKMKPINLNVIPT